MANRRTMLRRWFVQNRGKVEAELSRRKVQGEGLYWDEVMAWARDTGAPVHEITPKAFAAMWNRSLSDKPPLPPRSPPRVTEHPSPEPAKPQPVEKPADSGDGDTGDAVFDLLKGQRFE